MEKSLVALHQAIPVPLPPRAMSIRHLIELVAPTEHCRGALVEALGFTEPEKAVSLHESEDAAKRPPHGEIGASVIAAQAMASICSKEAVGLCGRVAPVRTVTRHIGRLVGQHILEHPLTLAI